MYINKNIDCNSAVTTQTDSWLLHCGAPTNRPPGLPAPGKWRKGESLGGGAFGNVYVALNCDTGELLAVKEIAVGHTPEKASEAVNQLEQEVSMLSSLRHPNIVQYVGTQRQGDSLFIFLEYVPVRLLRRLLDTSVIPGVIFDTAHVINYEQ